MVTDKVTTDCFINAKENAEKLVNRKLSREEDIILMVGLLHGKNEGDSEGQTKGIYRLRDGLVNKLSTKQDLD